MANPITLFADRGEAVPTEHYSVPVAAEVQEIAAHNSVGNVSVRQWNSSIIVLVEFELDQPAAQPTVELLPVEPIAL
ncbi:MAG: hypothetical protein AAF449_15840, partial [Myxococcota bacterium]